MSEAPSHSSHGSQGSLGPDDSISQVLPQYFTDDFRLDIDLENESSNQSESLSSAPSGLLTLTYGSDSSEARGNQPGGESSATITGDISGMHLNVPDAFLPKRKARKGYCWLASNGTEVFEKGKWRWRCARCKSLLPCITLVNSEYNYQPCLLIISKMPVLGPRSRAPVYADSSTKNMNHHLATSHSVTKNCPEGGQHIQSTASESRIVAAFGRTLPPGLQFNSDIFKLLLIRWIYVTNTAFYAVEDPTFRILLHYLLCCVSYLRVP